MTSESGFAGHRCRAKRLQVVGAFMELDVGRWQEKEIEWRTGTPEREIRMVNFGRKPKEKRDLQKFFSGFSRTVLR